MRAALLAPLFAVNAFSLLLDRQFPHLIIPVNLTTPDTPLGTQTTADVEHFVETYVSFDVPNTVASSCSLNFFISLDKTYNAPWTLWGEPPFRFNVSSVEPTLNKDATTWNNRPRGGAWVATIEVGYDGIHNITGGSVPCTKGQPSQFLLYPADKQRDFGLRWFELNQPIHGITFDSNV